MKVFFKKSKNGGWYPIDGEGKEYCKRRKVGTILNTESKQSRNYEFHKKAFALFNAVHDNLPEPGEIEFMGKMIKPAHTPTGTRKYITVKAGYFNIVGYPDGGFRVEAKSLRYDSMEPDEFERFYSAAIDASLKILGKHWTGEELRRIENEIVRFDS